MKIKNITALIALTVFIRTLAGIDVLSPYNKENDCPFDMEKCIYRKEIPIWKLVKYADVVGVGHFMTQPSLTNNVVGILINDCWIGNVKNNMADIIIMEDSKLNDSQINDWLIPTNTPIVFFAMNHITLATNECNLVLPEKLLAENQDLIKHISTNDSLMFLCDNRAWFHTTGDNGLLYTYTTNLWDAIRANPNHTNYFNAIYSADSITHDESGRIWHDNINAFQNWVSCGPSAEYLVEILQDPNLSCYFQKWINFTLHVDFKWGKNNSVWFPILPPTPYDLDADGNGIIDIWENQPFLYGTADTNGSGFTDLYEIHCLAEADDKNYDVLINLTTSTSVALTWGDLHGDTKGIVIPAPGAKFKLRLPLEWQRDLRIIPYPDCETQEPPEALWGKTWDTIIVTSYAPRDGQTNTSGISSDKPRTSRVLRAINKPHPVQAMKIIFGDELLMP